MKKETKTQMITETQYVVRTWRGNGVALAVQSSRIDGLRELRAARKDRPGEPLRLVREDRSLADARYADRGLEDARSAVAKADGR